MKYYYLIICLVLVLTGCGGGSSSDDSNNNDNNNTDVKTGVFLVSPVINLGYKTETQSGFTNSLGEYRYVPGETVEFFIGNLEFTPVRAAEIVTPFDIAGTTTITNTIVVNIIRLLLTLDKDGNPDNGLEITRAAIGAATAIDFGLSEVEFESLSAVKALLDNAGLDTPVLGLVDTAAAIRHFEEIISNYLGSKAFPSGVVLTGNTVGDGSAPNSTLRKKITFTVTNPDSRLSFSDAYAAKSSSTSLDTLYWMVFATNISDEILCFVKVSDGVYKDSQGQTLGTKSIGFVRGSVRLVSGSVATNTCLLVGEKGLLLGIETRVTNIYSDISEIVYDKISVSSSSSTPANTTIEHTGTYQATPNAYSFPEISLPVRNTGTTAGKLTSLSEYILLDEADLPLRWGFLSVPDEVWDGVLDSNETQSITGRIIFDGTANNMHVYVDYDDFVPLSLTATAKNTATISPSALSGDEYAAYMNDARNQAEAYKASLLAE